MSDTWNDEKETIFFFPGLTADHTMFESQVDYFGEKYNLIAWDALLRDNKDLNISCPVLITHGEYDKTGKVRYYCKIWHEQTNYPLQIIKGAGHNANVDKPEEMNSIIEEFLEEKVLCS